MLPQPAQEAPAADASLTQAGFRCGPEALPGARQHHSYYGSGPSHLCSVCWPSHLSTRLCDLSTVMGGAGESGAQR
jgi:hypothetical protein